MANQGTVSFPGVSQVVSASYTLQHGITPGIASVETAPQANFAGTGGTLTFTYYRDAGGRADHDFAAELQDCSGGVFDRAAGAYLAAANSRPALEVGLSNHQRILESAE